MTFRLLLAAAMLMLPLQVRAADCVDVTYQNDEHGRPSAYASLLGDNCGALKIVDRHREDHRENVNVFATYAVFDPAETAAERRYNEWIVKRPAAMNILAPIDLPAGSERHDTMAGTLYRSPRLLSAAAENWVCCGAHGSSWSTALNIDAATGRDVQLDELVDVRAATAFCWRFLAREAPNLFTPDAEPTDYFASRMRSGWRVREASMLFDFGYLWGYAAGYFTCKIDTDALRKIAKSGVHVPF